MTTNTPDDKATEDGLFKYHYKVKLLKLGFAAGIGTIGILAGFTFGFRRSQKKYGFSKVMTTPDEEEPAQFALRALKRATVITVSCFLIGVGTVSLLFGVTSRDQLKDISRRKWRQEEALLASALSDEDKATIAVDTELLTDKAEELKV